jgi:NADH-quinone oxidoreductase subunit H
LPEAVAELVSGYNVEYSAAGFALFFIGEYANILLMSGLSVILFFGGWLPPFGLSIPFLEMDYFSFFGFWFSLKLIIVAFFFIWIRAAFPRFRYDQLMNLGWKVFLPMSLGWVFFVSFLIFFFLI